jgi:four helix bundle protein
MGMKFEDLEAWREARVVVRRVYDLTRNEGLKRDFGLCDQIQRSSVSVMTNIAGSAP